MRLASTVRVRWYRLLPRSLGPLPVGKYALLAMTSASRSCAMSFPRMRSDAPPAYTSAVSKKFTPASRQRAYSSAEVASSASPPNDMVPKHSSETRMPVPPRKT